MSQRVKYYLFSCFLFVSCLTVSAQSESVSLGEGSAVESTPGILPVSPDSMSASLFRVRYILIYGNKKTKRSIILRELPFKEDQAFALNALVEKFDDAKRQLMNTALFHDVDVTLKSFDGYDVDIQIDIKERWYLFPMPYLKPVDDFNVWTNTHKMDIKRLNYGVKLNYKNATGRNDPLSVKLANGYTKHVSLNYDRMYIDKGMQWGLGTKLEFGKNHEIIYNTINDKTVAFRDNNDYIRTYFKANIELTYRRAIKTRHRVGFGYTMESVEDTVVALNPSYFKNGRNKVSFPEIYYAASYNDVDYIPYPLQGYMADVRLSKRGFNNITNVWSLTAKGSGSWPIAKKTYFNLRASGQVKLPFNQPYYSRGLMGGTNSMQGFEEFSIDGVAGGYLKAIFIREVAKFNIRIPSKKFPSLNDIPFRFFAKVYGNAGYVYNPQPGENLLSNRMLYSGGFGIDMLTFYDFTFKFEWSFNPLGQNGLYLHQKNYF